MSLHCTAIVKLSPTFLARESDARVSNQMTTKTRDVIKGALTKVTLMLTLSIRVHTVNMLLQICLLGKTGTAMRTLMALCTRMCIHVTLENLTLGEGQLAFIAFIRLKTRMDDHVTLERTGTGQLQMANRTLERSPSAIFHCLDVCAEVT